MKGTNRRVRLVESIARLPQKVRGHGVRTGLYARMMALYLPEEEVEKSGLSRDELYAAYQYGGEYHDIGKGLISRYLMEKREELTEIEEEVLQLHPLRTEELLKEYFDEEVEQEKMSYIILDMGRYHHERADGSGYPYGFIGEEIPICAGICAIADTFDHMVEERTYRETRNFDDLYVQMEGRAGEFGNDPVACFIRAREEIKSLYLNQRKGRRK